MATGNCVKSEKTNVPAEYRSNEPKARVFLFKPDHFVAKIL